MTPNVYEGRCVFGLDIGTRSIVGTVGYLERDRFVVLGQSVIEHETRAMLDGQIHDIHRVGQTIRQVKEDLERKLHMTLQNVCIAAAGRVLRTVDVTTHIVYENEHAVTEDEIYELNSKGVEKAYEEFLEKNEGNEHFYCVGYSVKRYYLNDLPMTNLLDHKAHKVAVDMIATFLPDEVVDGLYRAVEYAGLDVVNLTLEPIAAMIVAIPEQYRMLNIALLDVGAGTSDISITCDGSIASYGMLPVAGDALTEVIAKECLVDFNTAELIKRDYTAGKEIAFMDIMGLPQTISRERLEAAVQPVIDRMTADVAAKMIELNGGRPVSAVFVVGGGGVITGYTQALAAALGIAPERVAVRGREVMGKIDFRDDSIPHDSRMVTPVGICLSYYEQSNNFIFVTFNEERVKLYDNGKLAVVDAAMNADFPSDGLFPRRGKELEFTVNGKARIQRGNLGEAAVIMVNGVPGDIHTPIRENDVIQVIPSTAGAAATLTVGQLPEYGSNIRVTVNGKDVGIPGRAIVNGEAKTEFYEIADGDAVEVAEYCTVDEIIAWMDIAPQLRRYLYVNHAAATPETKVYGNFTVELSPDELYPGAVWEELVNRDDTQEREDAGAWADTETASGTDGVAASGWETGNDAGANETEKTGAEQPEAEQAAGPVSMTVLCNGSPVTMHGKQEYLFVDLFDYISFDLSKPQGTGIVTTVNGRAAQYMEALHPNDVVEIYWK